MCVAGCGGGDIEVIMADFLGRGDIQQNLEGGVHLGFVQSLAELGTEFIGQGFATTSLLASVDLKIRSGRRVLLKFYPPKGWVTQAGWPVSSEPGKCVWG